MAYSTATSTQIEPPFEHRFALSHLLLQLFKKIDHDMLFKVNRRGTRMTTPDLGQVENLSNSDVKFQEEDLQYLEELTMHIILGDALQYLQVQAFGFITSHGVRGYSYEELIMSLKHQLSSPQHWSTRYSCDTGSSSAVKDEAYDFVQEAVRGVIAQLEKGNWPIEPVARVQESAQNGIFSESEVGISSQKSQLSVSPAYIKRSPSAISAIFTNTNAQASGQTTTHCRGEDTKGNLNTPSNPLYVRRSPGFVSAVFANVNPKTKSPTSSDCSITPSESISQVLGRYHTKQSSNPTAVTYRDEQLAAVKYIRTPGFLSASFNDVPQSRTPSPGRATGGMTGMKMARMGDQGTVTAVTEEHKQEEIPRALENIEALIDEWLRKDQGGMS